VIKVVLPHLQNGVDSYVEKVIVKNDTLPELERAENASFPSERSLRPTTIQLEQGKSRTGP
jgi:hypothetical protein